jgi:hypothetical protein
MFVPSGIRTLLSRTKIKHAKMVLLPTCVLKYAVLQVSFCSEELSLNPPWDENICNLIKDAFCDEKVFFLFFWKNILKFEVNQDNCELFFCKILNTISFNTYRYMTISAYLSTKVRLIT